MHSDATWNKALEFLAQDYNISQVARMTGTSRATVRYWRDGHRKHRGAHVPGADDQCPWLPVCDAATYAYLLGLYLGDGCISNSRHTKRLRVTLDDHYPAIQAECAAAIEILSGKPAGRVPKRGCSDISSYSIHWCCLFPQHGPGRKHERLIHLRPWQEAVVCEFPGRLLRGLIHSDGSRYLNTVRKHGKSYVYPTYEFSNHSVEIHDLFQRAAISLGLRFTTKQWKTTIARRADVALLDTFIGPKQ